jgi:hypothetical protein
VRLSLSLKNSFLGENIETSKRYTIIALRQLFILRCMPGETMIKENSTTTVNRKPALVHGLEGYKINKVACGSSHVVAWATTDLSTPMTHEPVLFSTSRDPLGATIFGEYLCCVP